MNCSRVEMISFDKIVHQLNKLSAACSTFQEYVESAMSAFSYIENEFVT